jgi:hypothetical protein
VVTSIAICSLRNKPVSIRIRCLQVDSLIRDRTARLKKRQRINILRFILQAQPRKCLDAIEKFMILIKLRLNKYTLTEKLKVISLESSPNYEFRDFSKKTIDYSAN